MSKKVIIGIHGLGNKPPKEILKSWWKQSMIEGLGKNQFSTVLPKFELVYWSDLLYDKPYDTQEKDPDNHYYLREKYIEADPDFKEENHSTRQRVIDFLDHQLNKLFLNDDFSLNYTVITDAIIGRYFRDLDIYYKENCTLEDASVCKTKELINQRLIDVIDKYKGYDIMIIGHSMGSIIGYEVLKFNPGRNTVNYFITLGSPLGLPVVIGKIAAEQKRISNEVNSMSTPDSVVKKWYNFSDILDKVAFNYRLADDFTENSHGVIPVDFLIVNDYEYNGKRNPHNSYGYLRAPEFSRVLNDFITDKLTTGQKLRAMTSKLIYQIKERVAGKTGKK